MPRCIGCREAFMKSADSALSARTAEVVPFHKAKGGRRHELAFMTAALEIVEPPPLPIGRAITAPIIVLFGAVLSWAAWGTVDIVASAPGKVVAGGRSKLIQPFETGVVREIRVQDGREVRAGDVR